MRKDSPAKEGSHGAKALTNVRGTYCILGYFVVSQDELELDVGMVWLVGKKGKKRPRVRRGGIRGVQKLFGLQAIEEFGEIYQSSKLLARLILRKM